MLLSLLLVNAGCQTGFYTDLAVSPSTINAISTLTFNLHLNIDQNLQFTTPFNIPAGSYIQITFPSDYADLTTMSLTTNMTGWQLQVSPSSLNINNAFPSAVTGQNTISFEIQNVVNPGTSKTITGFSLKIISGTNTVNETDSQHFGTITLEPDTLTFTAAFQTSIVSTRSTLTFTITPKTVIPINSQLQIKFEESSWSMQAISEPYIETAPACTNTTNQPVTCTGAFNQGYVITVTGFFTSATSDPFVIKVQNLLSPPTVSSPSDPLTITTIDPDGNRIDVGTFIFTNLSPQTITPTVPSTSGTVRSTTPTFAILYRMPVPMLLSDKIVLSFQDQVILSSSTTATLPFAFPQTSNLLNNNPNQKTITITLITKNADITNPSTNYALYIDELGRPPSTKPSDITVQFTRSSNSYATFTVQLVAASASFTTTPTLSYSSTTVSSSSILTLSITPTNQLTTNGGVQVTIPSGFTLPSTCTSTATSSSSSIISTPTCTVFSSTNSIRITSLFSSQFTTNEAITIEITSLTNPVAVTSTADFVISTFYQTNIYLTDSFTGLPFTPTPGTVNTFTPVPALGQTLVYTDFTFNLQFQHTIPASGSIVIVFPSEITMLDTSSRACKVTTPATTQSTITCNYGFNSADSTHQLTFTQLPTASQYTLLVQPQQIRNPMLASTVSSFKVTSMTSAGDTIDHKQQDLGLTISTACKSCASISIIRASTINSAQTSYTFILSTSFIPPSNMKLQITLPSQITDSGLTCTNATTTSTSCQVTISNNLLIITLTSSTNTQNHLQVSGLVNPISQAPTSQFPFEGKASTNQVIFTGSSAAIQNDFPSSYTVSSYSFNQQLLQQPIEITVQLVGRRVSNGGYVVVTIPPEFSGTAACSGTTGFTLNTCTMSSDSKQLTITSSSGFNEQISFTIQGLTAPSTDLSSYFQFSSYDSNGYLIDQNNHDVRFSLLCNLPCKTCSSAVVCQTCYSDSALVSNQVVHNSGTGTCDSPCALGSFQSSGTCITCSVPCRFCTGSSTTSCTACNQNDSNNRVILDGGECKTACPAQTFVFTDSQGAKYCSGCINNCDGCESAYKCTSCKSTYFLTATGICTTKCPLGTFSDTNSNQCAICTTGCLACTSTAICSSCAAGYTLATNTCTSDCQAGTFLSNGVCQACDNSYGCQSCLGTLYSCSSCSSFLSSLSCVTSCQSTRYFGSSNICSPCISPCLTCSTTATTCDSCIANLLLHANQCVPVCPYGFYSTGTTCLDCTNDCAACSGSSSTCTGCTGSFNLQGTQCVTSCTAPTISFSNICAACTSNCATCQNVPSQCLSCQSGYILSGTECVSQCTSPKVRNIANTTCVDCDTSLCKQCSGVQNICSSCDSPNFLSSQTCITTCPDGTFGHTTNRACTACSSFNSNCALCLQSGCTKCSTNFYLRQDDSCQSSCVDPLPVKGDGVCTTCPTDCQTCDEVGVCSQCTTASGKSVKQGTCVSDCGTQISVGGICTSCIAPCLTCITITTRCTSCISSYKLQTESCVTQCTGGLVSSTDGLSCVTCSQNCQSCTTVEDNCISCVSPLFLQNSQCVSTCSTGVGVNGICTNCPTGCLSCDTSLSCLICDTDFLLADGACLTECPSDFPIQSGRNCLSCQTPCTSCNSSSYCFSCSSPSLVLKGECVTQCPSLYQSQDGACVPTSTVINITTSNNSSGILPVPCTITGTVFVLVAALSKFSFQETRLISAINSMVAFPEAVSWWVLLGIQFYEKNYELAGITAAGAALLLICNIISIILWARYIFPDETLDRYDRKKSNYYFSRIYLTFSTIISFKGKELIFTRLFGCELLSARLSTVRALFSSTILAIASLLTSSILCIISSSIFARQVGSSPLTQSFMQAIDTLIISIVGLIFSIANLKKSEDYFSAGEHVYNLEETEIQLQLQQPVLMATDRMEGRMGKSMVKSAMAVNPVQQSIEGIIDHSKDSKQHFTKKNTRDPDGFLPRSQVLRTSDDEDMEEFMIQQDRIVAADHPHFNKRGKQQVLYENEEAKVWSENSSPAETPIPVSHAQSDNETGKVLPLPVFVGSKRQTSLQDSYSKDGLIKQDLDKGEQQGDKLLAESGLKKVSHSSIQEAEVQSPYTRKKAAGRSTSPPTKDQKREMDGEGKYKKDKKDSKIVKELGETPIQEISIQDYDEALDSQPGMIRAFEQRHSLRAKDQPTIPPSSSLKTKRGRPIKGGAHQKPFNYQPRNNSKNKDTRTNNKYNKDPHQQPKKRKKVFESEPDSSDIGEGMINSKSKQKRKHDEDGRLRIEQDEQLGLQEMVLQDGIAYEDGNGFQGDEPVTFGKPIKQNPLFSDNEFVKLTGDSSDIKQDQPVPYESSKIRKRRREGHDQQIKFEEGDIAFDSQEIELLQKEDRIEEASGMELRIIDLGNQRVLDDSAIRYEQQHNKLNRYQHEFRQSIKKQPTQIFSPQFQSDQSDPLYIPPHPIPASGLIKDTYKPFYDPQESLHSLDQDEDWSGVEPSGFGQLGDGEFGDVVGADRDGYDRDGYRQYGQEYKERMRGERIQIDQELKEEEVLGSERLKRSRPKPDLKHLQKIYLQRLTIKGKPKR